MRISDWSSDVCSSDLGSSLAASVIRTYHAQHTGKMSIARIWRGSVKDGDSLGSEKVSGLYRLMGGENQQAASAEPGELVALGRMDVVRAGDTPTETGVHAIGRASCRERECHSV